MAQTDRLEKPSVEAIAPVSAAYVINCSFGNGVVPAADRKKTVNAKIPYKNDDKDKNNCGQISI